MSRDMLDMAARDMIRAMRMEGETFGTRRAGMSTTVGALVILVLIIVAASAALYIGVLRSGGQMLQSSAQGPKSAPGSTATNSSTITTASVADSQLASLAKVTISAGAAKNVSSPGYSLPNITVVIGHNNTVRWTNDDSVVHTVTAKDGSFDSGDLSQNQAYTHTFTSAGTYAYFCKFHSWMHGIVTVK